MRDFASASSGMGGDLQACFGVHESPVKQHELELSILLSVRRALGHEQFEDY
jgi:hypothetical protein